MKRYFLGGLWISFFIAAAVGGAACGKPEENKKEPPASVSEEWREITRTPVQPDTEEEPAEGKNTGIVLKGEALTGLSRVGEDDPYYCNAEENIRVAYGMDDRSNKVCKDSVYGVTYFVNYGRDYFIYALRDGKSIPVVELPTTEIYCREGLVYFILLSPGKKEYSLVDSGPVACYNPVNGEIKLVTTQPAIRIAVYPDGIYLKQLSGTEEIAGIGTAYHFSYLFYSFEEKTLERRNAAGIDRIRGNLVSSVYGELPKDSYAYQVNDRREYGVTGYELLDAEDKRVGLLETLPYSQGAAGMLRVAGETVYCLEMEYGSKDWKQGEELPDDWHVFAAYHLDTGEREEICRLGDLPFSVYGSDFIVYKGAVYFAGGMCVRLNLEDGSCSVLLLKELGNTTEMAWFTDGENLFFYSGKRLYLYRETKREGNRFHAEVTGTDGKKWYLDYDAEFTPLGK